MKKALIWILGIAGFVLVVKYVLLSHAGECQRLQTEISDKLKNLAVCEQDSDCSVSSFSCPFSCETALNRANVSEAVQQVGVYNKQCMMVCPECPKLVTARAVCENGFCKAESLGAGN